MALLMRLSYDGPGSHGATREIEGATREVQGATREVQGAMPRGG
jgi:hypothetical protein